MFCTLCGKPVEETDRFCPSCGAPLEAPEGDDALATSGSGAPAPARTEFEAASTAAFDGFPPVPDDTLSMPPLQSMASAMPAATAAPASYGYQGAPDRQEAGVRPKRRMPRKAVVAIAAAALVLLAGGTAAGAYFLLGPGAPKPPEPAPAVDAAEQEGEEKDEPAPDASKEDEEDKAKEIPVRSGLSAYSWDELAQLAQQVESAPSAEEGLALAEKYRLVQPSGEMASGTKAVEMSDGTNVDMQLVGVLHDDKADGAGRAAFTFMAAGSYTDHSMNDSATNEGGWEGSGMRDWLGSSVLDALPDEVESAIVPVKKLTNNVGRSESTDCVSETAESLWLFSWTELFGTITWNEGTVTSYIDSILNEEGSQYRYFQDQGLADAQESDTRGVLKKYDFRDGGKTLASWWVRSSAPNRNDGFGDVNNGGLDNGGLATSAQGVVFGFCL